MEINGKKVFVGLSGGVDSAVSAALLKHQGYNVYGVFIKAWTPFDKAQGKPLGPCTWREDRRSAMRVAAILDIPFITLDLEKEYKKEVVDYMIREYKKGKTPNPDVMCNKEIKFGAFLKWAIGRGANFVATGHYAKKEIRDKSYELREGKDKNKDQSYFLWTLTQEQLKHTLFPVGCLQKDEVRKLAKKFGLPQATRKDSQGLCFLGQVDMKDFLSNYITPKKGLVLDKKTGKTIGCHNGAMFFTIGERHGFIVTEKTAEDKPLYVVSKDLDKNTISVSQEMVQRDESPKIPLIIEDINWVNGNFPTKTNISCRLRYRQEKIPCSVKREGDQVNIILLKDGYVASGQSVVFYDRDVCLGGGVVR